MLEVADLAAGYGDIIAVRDFSFKVEQGQIVALMGANGAGKSSTLMAMMGLVEKKSGTIKMNGADISAISVEARISRGLAIVPEGRRIFPDLSVHENLMVGGHVTNSTAMNLEIEAVYQHFPRLKERRNQAAGSLSGGEQQMLAMGRALISRPKLLIIDELSLGLMPKIVDECYTVIDNLKKNGIGILLVEQNSERALGVADFVCVLEAGNNIWSGPVADARNNNAIKQSLMGVG